MNTDYPEILDRLGRGPPARLRPLGGGCIASAAVATFGDGTKVFVKQAAGAPEMFPREAAGLEALAGAGALRVPAVLAVNREALVLEFIGKGSPLPDFWPDFGRGLARLHQTRGKTSGFEHDNFIGSTPQCNAPLSSSWPEAQADEGQSWPKFFLQRRLRYQVELAEANGFGRELSSLLDECSERITGMLSAAIEPSSLLHGDLWSGNFMVDEAGVACLIDPAVYFGHREADLAMTRLFGGFAPEFYLAYEEALPLVSGWEQRLPVYQLYHLLNHLNLFGGGYLGQCMRLLKSL